MQIYSAHYARAIFYLFTSPFFFLPFCLKCQYRLWNTSMEAQLCLLHLFACSQRRFPFLYSVSRWKVFIYLSPHCHPSFIQLSQKLSAVPGDSLSELAEICKWARDCDACSAKWCFIIQQVLWVFKLTHHIGWSTQMHTHTTWLVGNFLPLWLTA